MCAHKLGNTHTRERCTTHVCEPKAGCNPSIQTAKGFDAGRNRNSTARSPSRIPSGRRVWNKVSLFYLHKTCSVRCIGRVRSRDAGPAAIMHDAIFSGQKCVCAPSAQRELGLDECKHSLSWTNHSRCLCVVLNIYRYSYMRWRTRRVRCASAGR